MKNAPYRIQRQAMFVAEREFHALVLPKYKNYIKPLRAEEPIIVVVH